MSEGRKFDEGKPRWSLLPIGPLRVVVEVLTFGAVKYGKNNWMKVKNAEERYSDAALRHITSRLEGELLDEETNKSHLAHAICCLLFWLWFDLNSSEDS